MVTKDQTISMETLVLHQGFHGNHCTHTYKNKTLLRVGIQVNSAKITLDFGDHLVPTSTIVSSQKGTNLKQMVSKLTSRPRHSVLYCLEVWSGNMARSLLIPLPQVVTH